jgi:hypothetical protein
MKKFWLIAILLMAAYTHAYAQDNNSVTATVVDSDSTTWTNGTWSAKLINPYPNIAPTYIDTGLPVTTIVNKTALSGSGALSATMANNAAINPANTTWSFTICPNASFNCTTLAPITLAGSSQNISSQISGQIIAPRIAALGPNVYAYNTTEILAAPVPGASFFDTSTFQPMVWNTTAWVALTTGGAGPGGITGSVQYNVSGVFTGSSLFTFLSNILNVPAILSSNINNMFFVDGYSPSGCTIASGAYAGTYTTQYDCATASVATWIVANTQSATLNIGCGGSYLQNVAFTIPIGNGYSMGWKGCGGMSQNPGYTIVTQNTAITAPMMSSFAPASALSHIPAINMEGIEFNSNSNSQGILYMAGTRQSSFKDMFFLDHVTGNYPTVQWSDPSVANGGANDVNIKNVIVQTIAPGNGNGFTPAQITPNVVGGAVTSYTVVSGGSGYPAGAANINLLWTGYNTSTPSNIPCTTLPTATITVTAGAISAVTPVTNGAGCDSVHTTVQIESTTIQTCSVQADYADSTIYDLHIGGAAGKYGLCTAYNGDNTYIKLHISIYENGIYATNGNDTYINPVFDTILNYLAVLNDTQYSPEIFQNSNVFWPANSYYGGAGSWYIAATNGLGFVSTNKQCGNSLGNGSQDQPNNYTEYVSASGALTYANLTQAQISGEVHCDGSEIVDNNTNFMGGAGSITTPGFTYSGYVYTANAAPPLFIITGPGATTPTFSGGGGMFGVNAPSGVTGYLMELWNNGTLEHYVKTNGVAWTNSSMSARTYTTNTVCAQAGSSASTSLVACGSAASGSFSCSTLAAGGGTCVVTETNIDSASEIFAYYSATSVISGVTCNTVLPSTVLVNVTSKTAGTGFTITMPAYTINPACIDYIIWN